MQRKMKLIKKILQHVEMEHDDSEIGIPEFDSYEEAEVHYHIGLCVEAGYLVSNNPAVKKGQRKFSTIQRLTWAGHEALDRLRKEGCGQ